jgi:hypothetical protein
MLLDDVGITVPHALEAVREVETIADLIGSRLNEVELSRIGEPAGNECSRVVGSAALFQTRRNERSKLDVRC